MTNKRLKILKTIIASEDQSHLWKGFKELQHEQRGTPEYMFWRESNPGADNSGILQYCMEHLGDLIHRAAYGDWGGGFLYGSGAVCEKSAKLLSKFYSMSKDQPDDPILQAKRNWQYRKKNNDTDLSEEEFVQQMIIAAKRYSNEYEKLKPITKLQSMSKDAAVSLGRCVEKGSYHEVISHLLKIRNFICEIDRSSDESEHIIFEKYYER